MALRIRFLRAVRAVRPLRGESLGRGVALRGTVWLGASSAALADHVVIVDGDGVVAKIQPAARPVPEGVRIIGSPDHWIGPGLTDAHVHLAFGSPEAMLAGGVVGMRDLGAPPRAAAQWQTAGAGGTGDAGAGRTGDAGAGGTGDSDASGPVHAARLPGPCCLVSGPIITAPD